MEELRTIGIFSKLNDDDLEKLKSITNCASYSKDEIILSHGEQSSMVYFILVGSIRATTYSSRGKEICFQHLDAGDLFGEISAIDNLPRTVSVIAETDCRLGILEARQLWQLMENHPCVMEGILKRLTSLVRFLCSRVYEYGALGSRERIRAEILRIAKEHVVNTNYALIGEMPTHENIANRVASHREAVTKEFSHLSKLGLIEKKGKKLIVPDLNALSASIMENIA